MTGRRWSGDGRGFPRTARVNELLREIIADALEAIDDDRLELLTITGVEVDRDLRRAVVYYDSLRGEEGDPVVLEALGAHRVRLQASINRQAHLRRTPELSFRPDPAVRSGERIDELLRGIHRAGEPGEPGGQGDHER